MYVCHPCWADLREAEKLSAYFPSYELRQVFDAMQASSGRRAVQSKALCRSASVLPSDGDEANPKKAVALSAGENRGTRDNAAYWASYH